MQNKGVHFRGTLKQDLTIGAVQCWRLGGNLVWYRRSRRFLVAIRDIRIIFIVISLKQSLLNAYA